VIARGDGGEAPLKEDPTRIEQHDAVDLVEGVQVVCHLRGQSRRRLRNI
jgi:hypothetical protein